MSEAQVQIDTAPFLAGTGVTINPDGSATVTGAATLLSKKFVVTRDASISLFVQGTGTGAAAASGTPATAWKILGCNDYDSTRPVQFPGTFVDVTPDFGSTVGGSTPPGVRQFGGAFNGTASDRFATWVCPYAAIQFQLIQQSGTETIKGQFFGGEI
jgi:hypothetical protein